MNVKCIFITCALAAAVLRADQTVIGNGPQGPVYMAQVPYSDFLQVNQPQYQDEWCWAASISNVFRFYKHPVSQARIVEEAWGRIADLPGYPAQIAQSLNRDWVDDDGNHFKVRLTAAYDAQDRVNAINNSIIIDNIRNNRPLIICNTHHCMVMTEITYTQYQVLSIGVFDPFPGGPETHSLPPAEAIPATMGGQLMFVGAVSVSDDDGADKDSNSKSDNDEDSASTSLAGTWTGSVRFPQGSLRVVLHITSDNGDLSATIDSPDQGASGEDVDDIGLDGNTLKFSIDSWGFSFEGQVMKNGRISGRVQQHGYNGTMRLRKSASNDDDGN